MKLPNGDSAVIANEKLQAYCLNPDHEDGKHKAHLFSLLLGINQDNAYILKGELLKAAQDNESIYTKTTEHGDHYHVDFEMEGKRRKYIIRSLWIVKSYENFPRLSSCYIRHK